MRQCNIKGTTTEAYHPQQNATERTIQDAKAVGLDKELMKRHSTKQWSISVTYPIEMQM